MPVFGKHRNLAGDVIPQEAERLLGWVELELSHNGMLLRGYRSLFASLLLIAAGLAGAALLALRMGRTINRPLSQIKHAVAQLKDGHLETRLPPLGSQELDELASGINRMAGPCKTPAKNCSTASIRPPKTCGRTWKPSRSRTSNWTWRAKKRWRPAGSSPSSSPT
jgi:HAMP domain-containing protein